MILGIDTSYANYRPSGAPEDIDWQRAFASKHFGFVYARVGQGTNPANLDGVLYNTSHDAAKKAGIPFGAYHFYVASQDGREQANAFAAASEGRRGTLRPAIDVEEISFQSLGPSTLEERIANLSSMRAGIASAYKIPVTDVIIYTNSDTWSTFFSGSDALSGSQLWVAQYTYDPHHMPLPVRGFRRQAIHQFSDRGNIPGLMGDVDLDALYGTIADISL